MFRVPASEICAALDRNQVFVEPHQTTNAMRFAGAGQVRRETGGRHLNGTKL